MQVKAPLTSADHINGITLDRVQNAIEMSRPCIVISPPGFGQVNMIRRCAQNLGRDLFHLKLNDFELTDTAKIRAVIASIITEKTLNKTNTTLEKTSPQLICKQKNNSSALHLPHNNINICDHLSDNQRKVVLIIEHDFDTKSADLLRNAVQSYADSVRLNRVNQVLPILLTPLSPTLFTHPKQDATDSDDGNNNNAPDWLVVQPHELLTTMPLGIQQLLNSAPPHLHQSLLGITRLAESWPAMSALLTAKLRGLSAQQELKQSGAHQEDWHLYGDIGELQIPSSALKTTCSELLNNYQSLMSDLANTLMTHQEQMLLAHLSLFPPNIHPFLPHLSKMMPNLNAIIESLYLKNVLVYREEETQNSQHELLSFSNLAWRFFAQGHLRRSCSAASLNTFFNEMLATILEESADKNQDQNVTLGIEFALSAREFNKAIDLIIQQAQEKEGDLNTKMHRINQAVNWFRFIPQRLINLNSQARVIQSYHRLVSEQKNATLSQSHFFIPETQNTFKKQQTSTETAPNDTHQTKILNKINQQNRYQDIITNDPIHQPRINSIRQDASTIETPVPISLQQVEIPRHKLRPTQASLLLDIQQHVDEQRYEEIANLAHQMIEQAFNQQKPELFLHGLIYSWYHTQINSGPQVFVSIIENCLSDNRLSTHLNEFRYWLNQIVTGFDPRQTDDQTGIRLLDLPNMPHLSSLGQNLLGFCTSYINCILSLNQCNAHLASERAQEATYYAMNLPDNFSQTLMPLWLVETSSFLQQNLIHQAVTFIQNTVQNNKLGSLRINNPMLNAFEALTIQLKSDQPAEIPQEHLNTERLEILHKQIEAIALLWQHSYKKSDRALTKLIKKIEQTHLHANDLFPWIWFGPSSWYLLQQRKKDQDHKNPTIDLPLRQLESFYESNFIFDCAYLDLSKRETEILGLVVNGCSNEEISNLLCRSLGTIKLHVHSIYKKLNVSNRVNAIKKCQTSGFFGFGL